MTSVTHTTSAPDRTDVPWIVVGALKLGLLESIVVLLFSLAMRVLAGPLETVVCTLLVLVGVAAVTLLPGIWTHARTIEGLAGAAGIGLGATLVFLLVDVALLQNIGTYTNRWYAVGRSNWWYHPVWWMVGTFLPWMGAWALANRERRRGTASPVATFVLALGCAVLLAVLAVVTGFPGASWHLATFGVAFIPGVALAAAISSRL